VTRGLNSPATATPVAGELETHSFLFAGKRLKSLILIIGTVRLPPENLLAARADMLAMIGASRAEKGCLEYCYAEDVLEPGLIHVKEIWTSREALRDHFAAPHLSVWRAAWVTLQIHDRKLVSYEIRDPEPV
jgi:quinol monooxygenase YgiN